MNELSPTPRATPMSCGNLAHLLFLTGRRPAAIERLRQAIAHADTAPAALKSELALLPRRPPPRGT